MIVLARLARFTVLLAALGLLATLVQAQSDYRLPPGKLAKAEALYRTGVVMHVAGTLYGFVVLVLLLVSGVGVRFRSWAEAVSSRRWVQAPGLCAAAFPDDRPAQFAPQYLRPASTAKLWTVRAELGVVVG